MASIPLPPPARGRSAGSLAKTRLATVALLAVGGSLLVATYGTLLPLAVVALLALPIVFYLWLRGYRYAPELSIFGRSVATGVLAAGIAAYYAVVLFDPYQLASDAWSFYELSSNAGPARSLQDLQTLTEGAGAVILWSWFYNIAAAIGLPREPYVGIAVNIILVAITAMVCSRSARHLYGDDDYRLQRLGMFFTISGSMWLFAGIHIRDSSILLTITLLAHFWIAYLSRLEHRRIVPAVIATLVAMPVLEVLRKEFFYVPLLIGIVALLCLNFSRGRGDNRFITLVSILFGLTLAAIAVVAFGEQIQALFQTNQETYTDQSVAEARSGSLGSAFIVNQPPLIRIALGVPYVYYFPIPFWAGFTDATAILLFKSINAFSFYFISAFLFAGAFLIVTNRWLRSPGFLFVVIVPLTFSASIALTSLESRHFGVFLPLVFLVGLMPDLRDPSENRLLRFLLVVTLAAMFFVHLTWFVVRYA